MAEKSINTSEQKSMEDDYWFSLPGPCDDIIISTKGRIVRNLADFPFIYTMKEEDHIRINSLIYDVFSQNEDFKYVGWKALSTVGKGILTDNNILTKRQCDGLILEKDETTSLLINESDHIKLFSYSSGLDCEKVMEKIYRIDELMQEKLQFAAGIEFGYLTSRIKDCGTGLKFTLRCFIPAIVLSGQMDSVVSMVQEKKFCLKPLYKAGNTATLCNCIFDICSICSAEGTELDQMAAIQAIGMVIFKTERKIRKDFADNNNTVVLNFVKQAYARAMYSLLLSYEDSVDIVCALKWGVQSGQIEGISDCELNGLFYSLKDSHLKYLDDSYDFSYEKDVKNSRPLRVQRLRTIVLQDAFKNIKMLP